MPNENSQAEPMARLFNDGDVAQLFAMSKSWARQQRYRRRRGLPHFLTVDAVLVGTKPRYRCEDIQRLLADLQPANDNTPLGGEKP
jgi:hypothetical protein